MASGSRDAPPPGGEAGARTPASSALALSAGLRRRVLEGPSLPLTEEDLGDAVAMLDHAIECTQRVRWLQELTEEVERSQPHSAGQAATVAQCVEETKKLRFRQLCWLQRLFVQGDQAAGTQASSTAAQATNSWTGPEGVGGQRTRRAAAALVQPPTANSQSLPQEAPECRLIVGPIDQLGPKAAYTLVRYFSAYGTVVNVQTALAAVARRDGSDRRAGQPMFRVAKIQMASPVEATAVVAGGFEHDVLGVIVRVEKLGGQNLDIWEEDGAAHAQGGFGSQASSSTSWV